MTTLDAHAIDDEREAQVVAYRTRWGCGDSLARIMLALISCGMVEQGAAEDDPETAADLYSALMGYGLDVAPLDWRWQ